MVPSWPLQDRDWSFGREPDGSWCSLVWNHDEILGLFEQLTSWHGKGEPPIRSAKQPCSSKLHSGLGMARRETAVFYEASQGRAGLKRLQASVSSHPRSRCPSCMAAEATCSLCMGVQLYFDTLSSRGKRHQNSRKELLRSQVRQVLAKCFGAEGSARLHRIAQAGDGRTWG